MASIMCVVGDSNSDSEDNGVNGNDARKTAFEVVESEIVVAKEKGEDNLKWLELEELEIDDDTLLSLDLANKFPVRLIISKHNLVNLVLSVSFLKLFLFVALRQSLLALSLCGNKLENVDVVVQEVTKFKDLRALWLNNNTVVEKWYGLLRPDYES